MNEEKPCQCQLPECCMMCDPEGYVESLKAFDLAGSYIDISNQQLMVREFMDKFHPDYPKIPTWIQGKDFELTVNLIKEELEEYISAQTIVDRYDALLDLLYVVQFALIKNGMRDADGFAEVQRSNMTKVWPDGSVRRRESDGKVLKPDTYSPAELEEILEKQIKERFL